jgi:hypothetical protein
MKCEHTKETNVSDLYYARLELCSWMKPYYTCNWPHACVKPYTFGNWSSLLDSSFWLSKCKCIWHNHYGFEVLRTRASSISCRVRLIRGVILYNNDYHPYYTPFQTHRVYQYNSLYLFSLFYVVWIWVPLQATEWWYFCKNSTDFVFNRTAYRISRHFKQCIVWKHPS